MPKNKRNYSDIESALSNMKCVIESKKHHPSRTWYIRGTRITLRIFEEFYNWKTAGYYVVWYIKRKHCSIYDEVSLAEVFDSGLLSKEASTEILFNIDMLV